MMIQTLLQYSEVGHATAESVQANSDSLAYSLHGHTAVCLLCEVARVPPDILSALQ